MQIPFRLKKKINQWNSMRDFARVSMEFIALPFRKLCVAIARIPTRQGSLSSPSVIRFKIQNPIIWGSFSASPNARIYGIIGFNDKCVQLVLEYVPNNWHLFPILSYFYCMTFVIFCDQTIWFHFLFSLFLLFVFGRVIFLMINPDS